MRHVVWNLWVIVTVSFTVYTLSLATTGIEMSNISTSLAACSLKFSAKASSSALSLSPLIVSPKLNKAKFYQSWIKHYSIKSCQNQSYLIVSRLEILKFVPISSGSLSSCVTVATGNGVSCRSSCSLNRHSPVTNKVYAGFGQFVPVTCTTTAAVPIECSADKSSPCRNKIVYACYALKTFKMSFSNSQFNF